MYKVETSKALGFRQRRHKASSAEAHCQSSKSFHSSHLACKSFQSDDGTNDGENFACSFRVVESHGLQLNKAEGFLNVDAVRRFTKKDQADLRNQFVPWQDSSSGTAGIYFSFFMYILSFSHSLGGPRRGLQNKCRCNVNTSKART